MNAKIFIFSVVLGLSVVGRTQESSSVTLLHRQSETSLNGHLLLEPMLIGNSENFSVRSAPLPVAESNTSGSTLGYGLGLRAGVHVLDSFFVGFDGRYAYEELNNFFYQDTTATAYSFGPMIGGELPYYGIRLTATYIMLGEFKPTLDAYGLNMKFTDPLGWRIGAGIRIATVSVNLEYQDLTYEKTRVISWGALPPTSAVGTQAESGGYVLSLSYPFTL
jgi:hypothetical protein